MVQFDTYNIVGNLNKIVMDITDQHVRAINCPIADTEQIPMTKIRKRSV